MKERPQNSNPKKCDLLVNDLDRSITSKQTLSPSPQVLTSDGGQTTISPPAKVKSDDSGKVRVLASNIDSLTLTINVNWISDTCFKNLSVMKNFAIQEGKAISILLNGNGSDEYIFSIRPHGAAGHEWILNGKEYTLKIGKWMEPGPRPSIIAEIRSEVLWRIGPEKAVAHLIELIETQGASIEEIKPSRVDPCVDILMSENIWSLDLIKYRVTRSRKIKPCIDGDKIEGFVIGKGKISARIYDKPLEIQQISKKFWMYDIWGLKDVPDKMKIIRVEFQLRREALKELSLNSDTDLFECVSNLWSYCAQKWLKFQDRPGKHHTQRTTFDWWKVVQNGFLDASNANPLIRCKAMSMDSDRLFNSALGYLTSLSASEREINGTDFEEPVTAEEIISVFKKYFEEREISEDVLSKNVFNKRAKFHRIKQETKEIHKKRLSQGMPSDVPIDVALEVIYETPLSFVAKMEAKHEKDADPDFGDLFK